MQEPCSPNAHASGPFALRAERLGPMPILNHFLQRLGVQLVLDKHVPANDKRFSVTPAKCLGVLLRSIIVEREPIYRQQETVQTFAPTMYGLGPAEASAVGDDHIGRALDLLFEADRAALLTEVVVVGTKEFHLRFDDLHNDSTTVRFCGQYRGATGRYSGNKRTPWITYGHSKDHRPDLKQLLLCLTTSRDGGVPVQFRCQDGNTDDSQTHIDTWETLRTLAGKADFLYVADSKLCARESMDHIDQRGGRFVTVLPRSRLEDAEFRKWIQTNQVPWEKVWDRPNPRRRYGPRDRWYVFTAALPSREGWPVVWVFSTLLALRQEQSRRERIAAASEQLAELNAKLNGPKSRIRKAAEVDDRVQAIVEQHRVGHYLKVQRALQEKHSYRQTRRGRPGPDTAYRRTTRRRWQLNWTLDNDTIEYDRKSDGMYPLLTNDRKLTAATVLQAHKGQPTIEKRFEQTKTVHEIAPVFLKKVERIEALFSMYFIALLVQALIERQIRQAMKEQGIEELPIYPEERTCPNPTTEQILRLFAHTQRHTLMRNDRIVQTFAPDLTDLQKKVLALLGVPIREYQPTN